jgi:hypothetical protein
MIKRKIADAISPVIDVCMSPVVLVSALVMWVVRRLGIWRLPVSKSIFNYVGIYPIRDHYYEPMFSYKKHLRHSLRDSRNLPGINMNTAAQLDLLGQFHYAEELAAIPEDPTQGELFYYNNPNFAKGDAEALYSVVRRIKPRRIVEIGSGFSTLIAKKAWERNLFEDKNSSCQHICVEPYEMQWLDAVAGINVIRKQVEKMDASYFSELEANDILFIDSSHMIRPQSDVLKIYLEILPTLNPGVYIHIHDIFTPYDYLDQWLIQEGKFWNEQYLLEALLSGNKQYEVILALNYLCHMHPAELEDKFPMLRGCSQDVEPRSFWIRKV